MLLGLYRKLCPLVCALEPKCLAVGALIQIKNDKSRLLKQQSRRQRVANGFALSPIRAVFSDSIVRVVETGR
jgi:hypothetical protein